MSHSPESIEDLIREGTNLKNKLGMLAEKLKYREQDHQENRPDASARQQPGHAAAGNNISFIAPLPGGLKNAITDIFSLVCSFDGINHGGIYIFDKQQRHLDLVCHYNLPEEFLARVITFSRDAWLPQMVLETPGDVRDIQSIPLHAKIGFEQFGIHAISLIPLIHRGRIVGCINLASRKEDFISGFEMVVIEGLALRIARTVALHLAQARLCEANEELTRLMLNLKKRFVKVKRSYEPESLTGFFTGMKDEIDVLCKTISLATGKIIQKLENGQRSRELPFVEKKVDAMLHDIDLIVQTIRRLRIFYVSQSTTMERGMLQPYNSADASFMESMIEFHQALEILVMDDKKKTGDGFIYRRSF